MTEPIACVLFDFDGTLADTAPDLAAAANHVRRLRHMPPLPVELLRVHASAGARGLLFAAMNVTPKDESFEGMRVEFLQYYEENSLVHTRLFDGVDALLSMLEHRKVAWGIVTNKAYALTVPIVQHLGLHTRAAAVVGGDTTAHPKPHPLPLEHAAQLAQVQPAQCLYVGDDLRDVQAGKAAGMRTIAAAFGYCGGDLPIEQWGADKIVHTTKELHQLLADWTSS